MKLRTLNNSIRLRLSKTEVSRLAATGRIEAETWITPETGWRFVLTASGGSDICARLDDQVLTVEIPDGMLKSWANNDQVSLRAEQPSRDGDVLRILVEKDFACLSPRDDDDEEDLFPHPQSGKATC